MFEDTRRQLETLGKDENVNCLQCFYFFSTLLPKGILKWDCLIILIALIS